MQMVKLLVKLFLAELYLKMPPSYYRWDFHKCMVLFELCAKSENSALCWFCRELEKKIIHHYTLVSFLPLAIENFRITSSMAAQFTK